MSAFRDEFLPAHIVDGAKASWFLVRNVNDDQIRPTCVDLNVLGVFDLDWFVEGSLKFQISAATKCNPAGFCAADLKDDCLI